MNNAYIIDAVRTPRGKGKKRGSLASVHPQDLSAVTLKALAERNSINPDKVEEVTETGIVLPVEARKRPNTGIVVSIGHLVADKCPISPGDHILYQRYSGLEVSHSGQTYHMIMANDILGKFTDAEATHGLEVNMPA